MSSTSSLAGAGVSGGEAEVLALLGDHLSHAEIAAHLFISVRTVESHVASLRRKLGVGSHRELVRLAAGDRAAGAGREPAAPRLPFPLTSFVGRDRERAALAAALGTSRLVSAVGPGGIGKTRLALAVAADLAAWYPDGTWYADLVPVADPALLAAAVGERRALLVLDNCEHLVNAVAVLTGRRRGRAVRPARRGRGRAAAGRNVRAPRHRDLPGPRRHAARPSSWPRPGCTPSAWTGSRRAWPTS